MRQLRKWKEAGKLARNALHYGKELIKENNSMLNVTEKIEKYVFDNGGRLAFPTNLAINNVGAHWTPSSKTKDKFKKGDLVKLDVRITGEIVDALSIIVHKDNAYQQGSLLCKKLKEEIVVETFKAEGKKCNVCWKITKGKCERHGHL